MVVKRFEVWMVSLDPSIGSELKKARPCVIVSPDVVNFYLNTVTVLPLTSSLKDYPTRVHCTFQQKKGQIAVDQIRAIDKLRLRKKLGAIDKRTAVSLTRTLEEYFTF